MLSFLYQNSRHGTGWFVRARGLSLATCAAMLVLALGGLLAAISGWISPALASWFAFSLLPLAGLLLLQTAARLQETLTMRFGGRPIAVEGGEE